MVLWSEYMKQSVQILLFSLLMFVATPSHATTGIGSVSYLWGAVLILLVLIVVLVLVVRFLKNVRKDTMKYHNKEDE